HLLRDLQDRATGVRRKERLIERFVRHYLLQLRELLLGGIGLFFSEERRAAGVMPRAKQVCAGRWRFRLTQHLVPFSETSQGIVRNDAKAGEQRNCFQSFVVDSRSRLARRFDRELAVTLSR